ncbi:hypothetical protein [Dolichospermum phage Dfl-JY45]
MSNAGGSSPSPWGDQDPPRLGVAELAALLEWAVNQKVSDIKLQSDERPAARFAGSWRRIANRRLVRQELEELLSVMYAANAPALLSGGSPIDFAYQIGSARTRRLRFRVNATAGATSDTVNGIDVVLRVIPEHTPTLDDVRLEQAIVDAHRDVALSQGLVLVIGATGTGKSTTLAAMVDDIATNYPLNIITYESPIEFNLGVKPGSKGLVTQTEVPRHVQTFSEGVSNALRRAPNVILVGEARDRPTIGATVTAALTGHAVYTTLHAHSVAAALPRMVAEYPRDEMRGIQARLVDVIRLMMTQRLVRAKSGGRVALREWLVVDQDMRHVLAKTDPDALQPLVHRWVRERHQSLLCAAERHYDELAAGEFELIEAEWKEGAGHV